MKKLKIKSRAKPQNQPAHAGTAEPKKRAPFVNKSPEPTVSPEKKLNVEALDTLITQSEEIETSTRGFMEPAVVSKKKRGRPSNADKQAKAESSPPPPPPEAQAAPAGFDCKPACKFAFAFLSATLVRYVEDDRVAAKEEEIELLGNAWGAVAEKYLPTYLSNHGELILALGVTGGVGLRIYSVMGEIIEEKTRFQEFQARAMRGSEKPTDLASAIAN